MRSLLREPLVHFLALGVLLFLFFQWRGGTAGTASDRIVVTAGQVEHLVAGFTRTWQRPPDGDELKSLLDEHVKEEIATREAVALGLDRDDVVIRRRLRQKLEFLTEDPIDQVPPTDAELQAWLDGHLDAYRSEPAVSFRQVLVRVDRRGERARADAGQLLTRLRALGADARTDQLGDPTMLPGELSLAPPAEIGATFGEGFAQQLMAIEPGQWAGPLESSYGLHLVLVRERIAPSAPSLAEVRPRVARDLLAERQRAELDSLYARLLRKYKVTLELPEPVPDTTAAGPE